MTNGKEDPVKSAEQGAEACRTSATLEFFPANERHSKIAPRFGRQVALVTFFGVILRIETTDEGIIQRARAAFNKADTESDRAMSATRDLRRVRVGELMPRHSTPEAAAARILGDAGAEALRKAKAGRAELHGRLHRVYLEAYDTADVRLERFPHVLNRMRAQSLADELAHIDRRWSLIRRALREGQPTRRTLAVVLDHLP
ncbi:MAG: hypothetical protein ACKVP3_02690 [Hyphomicrobiaceae bacterium]